SRAAWAGSAASTGPVRGGRWPTSTIGASASWPSSPAAFAERCGYRPGPSTFPPPTWGGIGWGVDEQIDSRSHVPGRGPPPRGRRRRRRRPGRDAPRPPRLREAVAAAPAHGGRGRGHALPRADPGLLLREAAAAPPVPGLVSGGLPRPAPAPVLL